MPSQEMERCGRYSIFMDRTQTLQSGSHLRCLSVRKTSSNSFLEETAVSGAIASRLLKKKLHPSHPSYDCSRSSGNKKTLFGSRPDGNVL